MLRSQEWSFLCIIWSWLWPQPSIHQVCGVCRRKVVLFTKWRRGTVCTTSVRDRYFWQFFDFLVGFVFKAGLRTLLSVMSVVIRQSNIMCWWSNVIIRTLFKSRLWVRVYFVNDIVKVLYTNAYDTSIVQVFTK